MSFQGMGQQQAAAVPAEGTPGSNGGAIGPVIGVLAAIAVLAVAAGLTGRLCSGRKVFGLGRYDVEGWMDKKFGRCIDGKIEDTLPPPPPPPPQRQAPPPAEASSEPLPAPVVLPVEVITVTRIPEPLPGYSAMSSAGGFPGSLRI